MTLGRILVTLSIPVLILAAAHQLTDRIARL